MDSIIAECTANERESNCRNPILNPAKPAKSKGNLLRFQDLWQNSGKTSSYSKSTEVNEQGPENFETHLATLVSIVRLLTRKRLQTWSGQYTYPAKILKVRRGKKRAEWIWPRNRAHQPRGCKALWMTADQKGAMYCVQSVVLRPVHGQTHQMQSMSRISSESLRTSLSLSVSLSLNIFNLVSIAFQLAESQVSTDGLKITPKWAASKEFIRLGLYRKRFV